MAIETYTVISSAQTDADSPLDEPLMDGCIRKDLLHIRQALYGKQDESGYYTPIWGHDHNGYNSAGATVADAAISQAKLKTSTSEVSQYTGAANLTLGGGEYGFYPQIKVSGSNASYQIGNAYTGTGYLTNIYLSCSGDMTAYAKHRYVSASGKEHWLFLIFNKKLKKVMSAWSAPDHPSYGNGNNHDAVPHPFLDFFSAPLPADNELILLDMDSIEQLKAEAKLKNMSILEYVNSEFFTLNLDVEIPWFKRDIDGKKTLDVKPDCYKVRSIVV